MRYPFRDKRLAEFMLQIPSRQLNFNNTTRVVMRDAMKAKLSKQALSRNGKAVFTNIFKQGVIEQEALFNDYFYHSCNEGLNYVKADYINNNGYEYNVRLMLRWMCVYLQFWKENKQLA